MKLSAIIALALSLSAVARPLARPQQSESGLGQQIPTNPSEKGVIANLPRLKKWGNTIGKSSRDPSDTNPSASQKNDKYLEGLYELVKRIDIHRRQLYAVWVFPRNTFDRERLETATAKLQQALKLYLKGRGRIKTATAKLQQALKLYLKDRGRIKTATAKSLSGGLHPPGRSHGTRILGEYPSLGNWTDAKSEHSEHHRNHTRREFGDALRLFDTEEGRFQKLLEEVLISPNNPEVRTQLQKATPGFIKAMDGFNREMFNEEKYERSHEPYEPLPYDDTPPHDTPPNDTPPNDTPPNDSGYRHPLNSEQMRRLAETRLSKAEQGRARLIKS